MPYKSVYVEPEVFLVHKGVTVYHCYKNGDFEFPFTYWFSLEKADDGKMFNVRELPNDHGYDVYSEEGRKQILMAAIDSGVLEPLNHYKVQAPSGMYVCIKKRRR